MEKLFKTLTGVKPYGVDIERQKYFRERDLQDELEDLLIRLGKVKKFEKAYIPQEAKGRIFGK